MRAKVGLKKVVLSSNECIQLGVMNSEDLIDALRIWTFENCGDGYVRSDFEFVAESYVYEHIESRKRASEIFQYVVSRYSL